MTTLCPPTLHENAAATPRPLPQPIRTITQTLAEWQARYEHRKQLRSMPDYLLRDIGLSADDVMEESAKPFWQP